MTARTYPVDAVSGAPSYTGRALRQTLSTLLPGATSARPLGAQSGVRPGTPATTVSVASSTYTVTPHSGVLDVETAAAAGPYLYAFDANVTGSVNAAHATYTRWDGIYVQLSDSNESDGTSGTPGVAIVYVAGTASASPAMPTQPARSLLLAKIVVPNSGGGASSVVWLAPTIINGPASFASLSDLNTRNPASATNVGFRIVVGTGSTMLEYVSDGTTWKIWAGDVSGLITAATNWQIARMYAAVTAGHVMATFALTRLTSNYGPSAVDTAAPILNLDASIRPGGTDIGMTVGPTSAAVYSGARNGTLSVTITTTTLSTRFDVASGPYLMPGGYLHGSAFWRIG